MIPIKDTLYRIGMAWVTSILILINSIIFIFEISLPGTVLTDLFYLFGLVPARYTYPHWAVIHNLTFDNYFSFFTNMFLHGGWLHLIGNMWFLWLFGRSVEDRIGHARFLALYLLSGLGASFAYFFLAPGSTVPAIGASGAIAGVMGAYMVLFPRAKILTLVPILFLPLFIELSAYVYVAYWFLFQLVAGVLSLGAGQAGGGIAWWGHVGGFIVGIVLIFLLKPKELRQRKQYPDERYRYVTA